MFVSHSQTRKTMTAAIDPYVSLYAVSRNASSLLLQKGVHDIDVVHWLAGGYTIRASAMGGLLVYGQIEDRCDRGGELMTSWYDPVRNWPPLANRGLHPVVDVEDLSMVHLALDGGALASYQQCHFTPDYWRNYTVVGTEGRLENFGDLDGAVVKVWNRRSGYRSAADRVFEVPAGVGGHGGADAALVDEFLRFLRNDAPTVVSPVAARQAVAAAAAATVSLRTRGVPVEVPSLEPGLAAYFDSGQHVERGPDRAPVDPRPGFEPGGRR